MLSAISHDLKTPLASILGAATSLGSYSSYFEQQERDELVTTIREEAERMSCFVANLLDITRVESGTLEVRSEATDVEELIGATVRRGRRLLGSRRLTLRVAADLPMLYLDGVLLEQTLFNLLDNAAKYSPQQSTIVIEARRVNDRIVIKVMDEGGGIPPRELKRIFEKFYRSGHSGRQRAGTGLGLAICRGFVEAMGGRIIAGNRTDRPGAVFMIGFPLPRGAPLQQIPVTDDD
jgi:two-component system sensor histidine kinase KdpD